DGLLFYCASSWRADLRQKNKRPRHHFYPPAAAKSQPKPSPNPYPPPPSPKKLAARYPLGKAHLLGVTLSALPGSWRFFPLHGKFDVSLGVRQSSGTDQLPSPVQSSFRTTPSSIQYSPWLSPLSSGEYMFLSNIRLTRA